MSVLKRTLGPAKIASNLHKHVCEKYFGIDTKQYTVNLH